MKIYYSLFSAFMICFLGFSCSPVSDKQKEMRIAEEVEAKRAGTKTEYNGFLRYRMNCSLTKRRNSGTSAMIATCSRKFEQKYVEGNGAPPWSVIYIYCYRDGRFIKNELITEYLRKSRARGNLKGDIEPLTVVNNSIIQYMHLSDDKYIEWVSGKYWISIVVNGAPIPEDLLNEYLTAFPPTVNFTEADFSVQGSLKNGIVKLKFQRIHELEDKRNWFNRYINRGREYVTMSNQCWEEQMVRCYVGLTAPETGPSCPIAFIDDKEERLAAYAKLEAEVDKLPVIVENINFGDNMMGRCGVDMNETYQIADHLHVPKFLVKGVIDYFTPVR